MCCNGARLSPDQLFNSPRESWLRGSGHAGGDCAALPGPGPGPRQALADDLGGRGWQPARHISALLGAGEPNSPVCLHRGFRSLLVRAGPRQREESRDPAAQCGLLGRLCCLLLLCFPDHQCLARGEGRCSLLLRPRGGQHVGHADGGRQGYPGAVQVLLHCRDSGQRAEHAKHFWHFLGPTIFHAQADGNHMPCAPSHALHCLLQPVYGRGPCGRWYGRSLYPVTWWCGWQHSSLRAAREAIGREAGHLGQEAHVRVGLRGGPEERRSARGDGRHLPTARRCSL
mmetsp:Transcript_81091/g.146364  ORF Transcript_81091/g.146364 Transcript_81091/m.146364 type:complete len:285 (+) Transcript_81091:539-1393(+)